MFAHGIFNDDCYIYSSKESTPIDIGLFSGFVEEKVIDEKVHTCYLCGYETKWIGNLNRHKKRRHKFQEI